MFTKKKINYIYLICFSCIFFLHFYQLNNQHWSGVLDQDLIIIYNSILLNSGIEQEYRDHPALTTFLFHSFIYKIASLFFNVPADISNILNSKNINEIFQFYFYISRIINFFINLWLIIIFNKILKKLDLNKNLRFLICITFIISIGYISSYFVIRSENLTLLLLCLSINTILSKNRDLLLNFFIAGIFFALAMLAKIQIIFLSLYLVYLIIFVNRNTNFKFVGNFYIKNYLFLSLFIGVFIFFIFQIHIQEYPRFVTNKYLDLIFFILSFSLFIIYFYLSKNFKKNLLLFSSMLNGFVFLIIFLLILDKINLLHINDYILLRITNPIHYMTEFSGKSAYGAINAEYILQNIFQFFSYYRFNLIELFIILSLLIINFKNKNYILIIFLIFLINTLVMNFRYNTIYHLFYVFIYLILFTESIKKFRYNLSLKFSYFVLFIFFTNSFNFFVIKEGGDLKKIFHRENVMLKICNELKFSNGSGANKGVVYIKYWHTKINDEKIKKICDEIV